LSGNFTVQSALVPEVEKGGRTLAIAVQLSMTASEEQEEMILNRLQEYDAVLFNPAALIRPRPSVAEREGLLERFRQAGYSLIRDYPSQAVVYCTRLDA